MTVRELTRLLSAADPDAAVIALDPNGEALAVESAAAFSDEDLAYAQLPSWKPGTVVLGTTEAER